MSAETLQPLLDVRDLRIAFRAGRRSTTVVHGIDLRVERGECVALVGASGSGKSATARALVGLSAPGAEVAAERLQVVGHDALELSERGWRGVRGRGVGLVLQDALTALDPLRTVAAEVGEPLRVHTRLSRAEVAAAVLERLAAVGVPDPERRAPQHPHELSGGLRQRALIATALAADPPLLIADEPTTALDVTIQRQVLDLLDEVKRAGRGLLLVSHDLAVVARIADHIAVMDAGRIVEHGPAETVLRNPGHDVTRALLDAIPRGRRADGVASVPTAGDRAAVPTAVSPATAPPTTARPTANHADNEPAPLVVVRGVAKRYAERGGGGRDALGGVDLELHAGETVGVVGESGSGKSTLAQIVLGLLEPDRGTVRLDGAAWSGAPERRRRPRRSAFGLVPQDPLSALDPRHTVRAVLAESRGGRRLGRRDRDDALAALLAEVGLDRALLDRRPAQLSGGQRQRVAIARALASGPRILVCDEPVSALDVRTQAQILTLLGDVQRARGLAILLISHDLAVVREVCDRVSVLRDGLVVERGPVEAIFATPEHAYTRELLDATPDVPARVDRPRDDRPPAGRPNAGERGGGSHADPHGARARVPDPRDPLVTEEVSP